MNPTNESIGRASEILHMVVDGRISGRISEWPQLKWACEEAARELDRLYTRAAGVESRVYWKGEQITTTERLIEVVHAECSAAWDAGNAAGSRMARDALARVLYGRWTDNQGIHCNRFPSWRELSDDNRAEWIAKAYAAIASQAKEGE